MVKNLDVALLYRSRLQAAPSTLTEHVQAFPRHSAYGVVAVNTDAGFPEVLNEYQFAAVVVHNSFFDWADPAFYRWIDRQTSAFKAAFIQDEYMNCQPHFAFLDRFDFHCVFTCLEPGWREQVYGQNTGVRRLETVIPGYVSEELLAAASARSLDHKDRPIDVGYRARELPYFMGRGGQEKHLIARGFAARAEGMGLVLDLATSDASRLYGSDWHGFLASCKGVLGVETGTSIFDVDGTIREACDRYLRRHPQASFEDVSDAVLAPHEGRIYYRTIGPRHFEAAAFGCAQILFEGRYSGIMQPELHYLRLRKDFSNFSEVAREFMDEERRHEIRDRAHSDLIASGKYSYEKFIGEHFDGVLREEGILPEAPAAATDELRGEIASHEDRGALRRYKEQAVFKLYNWNFPGRPVLVRLAKSLGLRSHTTAVNPHRVDSWDDLRN